MTTTQQNKPEGASLDELIKQKGYKKQKLAIILGITEVTFSKKTNNPDQFTIRDMLVMANFLKYTPEQIFMGLLKQKGYSSPAEGSKKKNSKVIFPDNLYQLLGITEVTYAKKLNSPELFTLRNIFTMADLLKHSPEQIFEALLEEYEKNNRSAEGFNLN